MHPKYGAPIALLSLSLLLTIAVAQPPQPPALPPINPALARLDVTLNGIDGPGTAVAYSEQTGILAASCETGSVRFWTKESAFGVRGGEPTPLVLEAHKGQVSAMAWEQSTLVTAGADRKLVIWQMPDCKALQTLSVPGVIRALALSADAKLLATGSDEGPIQLWDTATGKPGTKLEGHTDWILALAFSSDGKKLASGGQDATVRIWDIAEGKKLQEIAATPPPQPNNPPPPPNRVQAVAFNQDGSQIAFGGSDGQVYLAGTADGKIIRPMTGHGSSVTSLAFHPGGTLLISASKDRTVRLWNPANGQPFKSLEGHDSWVQGVALFAQGTRLASVGADHTVRIWDLTEPPKK